MPSARQSIEIDATPEQVMAVLTDFEAYPAFLPEIEAVDVISASGDAWEVCFHAHVIRPLQYTLRLVCLDRLRLTWSHVSGLFSSNDGSWELEPLQVEDGARTRATYTIDLVLGVFVPQALVNSLVGESLPAMLARFKERVERE